MNHSSSLFFALVLVLILAPIANAETTNVSVTIDLVNSKRPVISVTYGSNSRQLALADNVSVEIDGKKSDYRSLLPGDKAIVTYDKAKSVVTKVVVQRDAVAPAESLAEGWQEIDQRLIFLMIRLANVEASLEAVERAIGADNRMRGAKTSTARKADRDNEAMDRKGGGPVKWSQFYGMTAEKFFYHPTDRNSTYHTVTVLSQQGPQADNKVGGGVPAGQGLPAHQRPPQFDYIYRANDSAKARAEMEASELLGKVDALKERRQRLEAEQAGLWVEIAFRSIAHYDLDKKPVYRFDPLFYDLDADYLQRTETMRSASSFMALALSILAESEIDQQATFLKLKRVVAKGRQSLSDNYLRLGVESTDSQSSVGRFVALAKRLDDVAANLTDSYLVATEGDLAEDQQRKDTFRALLQSSLINYAQTVLAMDEMAELMKEECKYKPDVAKQIKPYSTPALSGSPQKIENRSGSLADLLSADGQTYETSGSNEEQMPKRRSPRSVRWVPKLNNEKSIKEVFDLTGNWRIELEGLQLYTGDTIETSQKLVGDFTMDAMVTFKVDTPNFYGIDILVCGEIFMVRSNEDGMIRLERKGDKIAFRLGNQQPKVLVIKESAINTPTSIRINCKPNFNYSGKSEAFFRSVKITGKAASDELMP